MPMDGHPKKQQPCQHTNTALDAVFLILENWMWADFKLTKAHKATGLANRKTSALAIDSQFFSSKMRFVEPILTTHSWGDESFISDMLWRNEWKTIHYHIFKFGDELPFALTSDVTIEMMMIAVPQINQNSRKTSRGCCSAGSSWFQLFMGFFQSATYR